MNAQFWQTAASIVAAYAALFGGIYAVVTAPLLRVIKAEVAAAKAELKLEVAAAETRLNERIDSRLVHR
jgi:hypothetical protein